MASAGYGMFHPSATAAIRPRPTPLGDYAPSLRSPWRAAREHAEQAIALAIEHGFPWPQAYATVLHGWALAEDDRAAEGIAEISKGLAALEQMGHRLWRPHQQGLLDSALGRSRQTNEALAVITQAIDIAIRTEDLEHSAELNRQKGQLLLQYGDPEAGAMAEECFQQAITIARRQRAKSWELRAAIDLARLWGKQGKRKEARELLAAIHGWFTEGFGTPDLQDAKALLAELS